MKTHFLAAASLLFLLTACDQSARVEERQHILIAGSSTVFPFSEAVAAQFHSHHATLAAPVV